MNLKLSSSIIAFPLLSLYLQFQTNYGLQPVSSFSSHIDELKTCGLVDECFNPDRDPLPIGLGDLTFFRSCHIPGSDHGNETMPICKCKVKLMPLRPELPSLTWCSSEAHIQVDGEFVPTGACLHDDSILQPCEGEQPTEVPTPFLPVTPTSSPTQEATLGPTRPPTPGSSEPKTCGLVDECFNPDRDPLPIGLGDLTFFRSCHIPGSDHGNEMMPICKCKVKLMPLRPELPSLTWCSSEAHIQVDGEFVPTGACLHDDSILEPCEGEQPTQVPTPSVTPIPTGSPTSSPSTATRPNVCDPSECLYDSICHIPDSNIGEEGMPVCQCKFNRGLRSSERACWGASQHLNVGIRAWYGVGASDLTAVTTSDSVCPAGTVPCQGLAVTSPPMPSVPAHV